MLQHNSVSRQRLYASSGNRTLENSELLIQKLIQHGSYVFYNDSEPNATKTLKIHSLSIIGTLHVE